MCVCVCVCLPVHQGGFEGGGHSLGLLVCQFKHTLDDGELCAGGVQATEGTPVIDYHACSQHVTASVDCASLQEQGEM